MKKDKISGYLISCPCCHSEHDGNKAKVKQLDREWAKHSALDEFIKLAENMLAVLNSSDSDHRDFLDSGADTIDLLWQCENEIRRLAKLAKKP